MGDEGEEEKLKKKDEMKGMESFYGIDISRVRRSTEDGKKRVFE